MRVAFDLVTPKQVPFFLPMIARLRSQGCRVSLTTREWPELNLMLRQQGMQATVLGRHGGGDLRSKLLRYAERVQLLAQHFSRTHPDVLVTLASPESTRAAFGLKIPVVCFMDLPESHAVGRLTLPLASKVCAPWFIPRREFLREGVASSNLFFYRALDPILWLKQHRLDAAYLETLGLDPHKPIIVCRETEWQSAYALSDIVRAVARTIRRRHRGWQIINIPRYRSHQFYDVPSLLAQADLLIGGGGTMCIEAAYYGTPVIATRRAPSRYMEWLFDRGLAEKCLTARDVVHRTEEIVASRQTDGAKKRRTLARRVFRRMTFPLDAVVELIRRTANGA